MNTGHGIYYSETQKALMWDRWHKGVSLQQIAQLFDRNHSSVERLLAETGGIRPVQRRRSRLAMTQKMAVVASQPLYKERRPSSQQAEGVAAYMVSCCNCFFI